MSFRGFIFVVILAIAAGAAWLILTGKKPPVSTEGISREARDVLDATKEYTVQQRQAFQQAIERELADMQDQIDSLRAKARQASGDARADLESSIAELEKKKRAAGKTLAELKSSKSK